MNKEFERNTPDLEQLADNLLTTFIQRRDLYAKQLPDGSYICIKKPLSQRHLVAHLQGEITLGTYVLDQESRANFIVFDADNEKQFLALDSMRNSLHPDGVPTYLESSRRGGHLWIFFDQSVQAKKARKFGLGLAKQYGLEGMELFPKQDKLSGGPGSLIRLPFGVHRRSGVRYNFLDTQMNPIATSLFDQIQIFLNPEKIGLKLIDQLITHEKSNQIITLDNNSKQAEGKALSEKLKNMITAYDFISKFVELSPTGHGKCPFHEDEVSSFAVNLIGNYWNCFAGCGGGSIIDFWMKYRKCGFTTAVTELAKIILRLD